MKRTKIVATIGPASEDENILKEMILSGVNVCRLNFSHGSHEFYGKVIKRIRKISEELQENVAILADLQGPKLRIGEIEGDEFELNEGAELKFTTKECLGSKECVYMTYERFPEDVNVGEKILLDDGKLMLEVTNTNGRDEVVGKVIYGGVLSSKKGVNLPNTKISLPSLTKKDHEDLNFALSQEVDWIGLSFVRTAKDITELKHIISNQKSHARVVAKIEKPEAIDDIDEIIKQTDAIMVARGDLGVEIPLQNVPLIQKMIIKKCMSNAKPVIVATQMMESMITSSSPTRAEVNDVANAVLDGADAVMLSGETSVGKYPIKVIETIKKIVDEIEKSDLIYNHDTIPERNKNRFISDSICFNAARLSERVSAKAIITMTFSGYTAYKISSQRPKAEIFVFTANKRILSMLSLVWGVKAFYYDQMISTDSTIADSKNILKQEGYLEDGDLAINIASMPIAEQGDSNMLKLSEV